MPDDCSSDVNNMDLKSHVEEIVAFFIQIGVTPMEAADCVATMVLDCYELYGTRH